MLNTILQNRYRIIEYIGCGGMAEVYKAIDLLLERDVAVKILRPQFARDENFIKRFRREAQSAARLSHNSIVSVFDVGIESDTYFIVMEYVPGETLQKIIAKEAPLAADRAIYIAKGIAKALSLAHKRGIIHCDIKPHNIIVDDNGQPKVSDFGIARAVSSATATFDGNILGSVHYLSPEQAQAGQVTYSSDLYSLGVVLFEMLTGKVPFFGETPVAIALQHVQATPPVLREFVDNIHPVLESIVIKAMAKLPEDRYASADDFINDLDNAQAIMEDNDNTFFGADTLVIEKVVVKKTPIQKLIDKMNLFWRYKWSKAASIFLLLITSFFVGMFIVFGRSWNMSEVKVPNVVGKQLAEAQALLSENKLGNTVKEEFDSKVPSGFIIYQSPDAGTIVKEQRQISIAVSKGPQLVNVPTLVGSNVEQAKATLQQLQLQVGRIEEKEDKSKNPGTIIAQNPAPPAQIGINSQIDLVVVAGEGKKITMPDLRGMTVGEVRVYLTALKLDLKDIVDQYTSDSASGTVVGQTPAPGQETKEGEKIVINVARPLSEQEKQGIVEFVVPPGGKNQQIKIIVTDSRSRRTVYEEKNDPGARIRQTIEGVGTIRIQFYSNNRLLEERLL